MPTHDDHSRVDEQVSLLIGGKVHSTWSSYDIDSDLLIPADAWQVELGLPRGEFPPVVTEGERVEVRIGQDKIMTGRIDEIAHRVSRGGHTLSLSGRDGAAILVDCSAPIFVSKQASLQDIVANVVKPLGISRIRIDAAAVATREKVNVEPGESAWDALVHAAEANGLWPWFEPDGTLVVGGPDYAAPPVASLVMRRDGNGNNVESLQHVRSIADRYSDITVLGQAHGTSVEAGRNALRASVRDPALANRGIYRPRVYIDHDADNTAIARSRARKLLSDARLRGRTLTATVRGHRTSGGVLWSPGQRVHVLSEPHEVDAVFFLMARKFTGGRGRATTTTLTLKEDGVWVLDAHPHKRAKKRGRARTKSGEELEIIDVA
ncbi:contractile injection system protein, VgrG/Pvc8 family [Cupriavidus gilardii]|uniref:Contractile injection system protein, VgrG/Pvc8 family n=1 Tax=Cupriavidus gilardii TaxID=82541 RepID=A0ABY4VLJ1_9BURK|nr:contractile injection system protein, VgrG/Pvc8 family [Cupriavidus gilardii]USE78058.1 contractile injection system protein, VgrG/Pvc8 family [Cupriavidus gilardii]